MSALILPVLFSPQKVADKELILGVQVTASPFYSCSFIILVLPVIDSFLEGVYISYMYFVMEVGSKKIKNPP
jgi:hypothetical protein